MRSSLEAHSTGLAEILLNQCRECCLYKDGTPVKIKIGKGEDLGKRANELFVKCIQIEGMHSDAQKKEWKQFIDLLRASSTDEEKRSEKNILDQINDARKKAAIELQEAKRLKQEKRRTNLAITDTDETEEEEWSEEDDTEDESEENEGKKIDIAQFTGTELIHRISVSLKKTYGYSEEELLKLQNFTGACDQFGKAKSLEAFFTSMEDFKKSAAAKELPAGAIVIGILIICALKNIPEKKRIQLARIIDPTFRKNEDADEKKSEEDDAESEEDENPTPEALKELQAEESEQELG